MIKKIIKCNTCKYFRYILNSEYGLCHRYPRVRKKHNLNFCGEWKEVK